MDFVKRVDVYFKDYFSKKLKRTNGIFVNFFLRISSISSMFIDEGFFE